MDWCYGLGVCLWGEPLILSRLRVLWFSFGQYEEARGSLHAEDVNICPPSPAAFMLANSTLPAAAQPQWDLLVALMYKNCPFFVFALLFLLFFFRLHLPFLALKAQLLHFFLGRTHSIWTFAGQASNPSCCCNLHHGYHNPGSLTHCAGPGIETAPPQRQRQILNWLGGKRNSFLCPLLNAITRKFKITEVA